MSKGKPKQLGRFYMFEEDKMDYNIDGKNQCVVEDAVHDPSVINLKNKDKVYILQCVAVLEVKAAKHKIVSHRLKTKKSKNENWQKALNDHEASIVGGRKL